MKKKSMDQLRVDPYQRLNPIFDKTSFAMFPTPEYGEMGFIVADDCPEEHIQ